MKIKCSELIKDEGGKISLGDCFIGDNPEIATKKLENYSRVEAKDCRLHCWLDIDLMWPRHVVDDKCVYDPSIYCTYDPKSNNGLRKMELEMMCLDAYPYHTLAEFLEKIDSMSKKDYFEETTPVVNPKSELDYISIASKYCEYELIWTKKDYQGGYFIDARITPNSNNMLHTPFDKDLLIDKFARKLAVEIGKMPRDLNSSELKEAMHRAGIE